MDVTVVNKNYLKGAVVLGIAIILLGVCFLVIAVSQPCSWLDLSLHYTSCIQQLDMAAQFNGVFTNDLTMFGGATANGMRIWRMNDGRLLHTIPGSGGVFSPDNALFVINSDNQLETISVWNTQDWTLQSTLDTDTETVTDIAIAPDANSLAVAGWNGLVQVWRTSDRKLHTLEGHTDHVVSVAYSPDGNTLASGGYDNTIRLWRVEDGRLLNTLEGHSSVVEKVVFAPDGLTLASASWDGTVRVWRTGDGTPLYTLNMYNGNVLDIAYSPTEPVLASAGSFGLVQLWDVSKGTGIRGLMQNWTGIGIHALAFSPDGKVLATAQRYGPVRLYDVRQLLGAATN